MSEPKLIFYTFLIYIFLLPLLFLPFNYEIFEFNKTILTFLVTTLITTTWITASIRQRRFIINTSFLSGFMLFFLFTQFISTLFSVDPYLSIWGYYSRFHQSFLHTLSFTLLYHAYITWIKPKQTQKIITALIISTTLVSLYGFLQHFGIDANYWVQDVKNRVFASLGQPNWLATWLILTTLPGFAYLYKHNQTISFLYFILNTITLLFTKSKSGHLGFFIAFLIFALLVIWHNKDFIKIKTLSFLTLIFIFVSFLIWNPTNLYLNSPKLKPQPPLPSKNQTINPPNITPSIDIRKIVWQGAVNLWWQNPKNFLIGTGVETFAFTYYLTRPIAHNLTSEWDFIYNKAHNEYLNFLATTGILGLISYLILIGTIIYTILKHRSLLAYALGSALIGYVIAIFFGFSVTPTTALLYLLPAFIYTLNKPLSPSINQPRRLSILPIIGIIIALFITIKIITYLFTWWLADFYLTQANKLFKQNNYTAALKLYSKSYQLNQNHPIFAINLAKGLTFYTLLLHQQKQQLQQNLSQPNPNLTQLQQQINQNITTNINLITSLTQQARLQHPTNIENQKQTIRFYALLGTINPNYYQTAIQLLHQLLDRAPTDPRLPYNLAILYSFVNQPANQEKYLLKAIQLKPNYDKAYHQLAKLYQSQNQTQKLQNLLSTWQKNHPASPTLKNWLKSIQ